MPISPTMVALRASLIHFTLLCHAKEHCATVCVKHGILDEHSLVTGHWKAHKCGASHVYQRTARYPDFAAPIIQQSDPRLCTGAGVLLGA